MPTTARHSIFIYPLSVAQCAERQVLALMSGVSPPLVSVLDFMNSTENSFSFEKYRHTHEYTKNSMEISFPLSVRESWAYNRFCHQKNWIYNWNSNENSLILDFVANDLLLFLAKPSICRCEIQISSIFMHTRERKKISLLCWKYTLTGIINEYWHHRFSVTFELEMSTAPNCVRET